LVADNNITSTKIPPTTITLPTDDNGLFITNKNPTSSYLIETNPEFALYKNFISSDYFLGKLNFDPAITQRRLGDALYENQLIAKSIREQTGKRYLNNNLNNDKSQYKYLMDNALAQQQKLELIPGVTLSLAQINALDQDIVWPEEQTIKGHKVLVPVVYIANRDRFRIKGSQIIANKNISLKTDKLTNTGTIEAGENINITYTDKIDNYGGTIKAKQDLKLTAKNDITNTSGIVKAKNIKLKSTKGSIKNLRYRKKISLAKGNTKKDDKTLIGDAGQITTVDNLNLTAKQDINLQGSSANAKNIQLDANNINININITTTINKQDYDSGGKDNYYRTNSTTHLGSNITANNININSKQNTTIKGSDLIANNNLSIFSPLLYIVSAINSVSEKSKQTTKSLFSKTTKTTTKTQSNNLQSTIKAKNLNITSYQTTLQASQIKAATADITAEVLNLVSGSNTSFASSYRY
jgi:adhesin HecA-like repeat protein